RQCAAGTRGGWRRGLGHPRRARERNPHVPAACPAVLSGCRGYETHFSLGRGGAGGTGVSCARDSREAHLPEPAVLSGANSYLFPGVDWVEPGSQPLVGAAGSNRRAIVDAEDSGSEWTWTCVVRSDRYVCFGRLGDVARPSMVLNNVRHAVHGGLGTRSDGICNSDNGATCRTQADESSATTSAPA